MENKSKTKTLLKGCLIVAAVILSLIIIGIISICISINYSQRQLEKKCEEKSLLCDTVNCITEQPEIVFNDFSEDEIDTLKFQILRNGELMCDTLISNAFTYISDEGFYSEMKIPYTSFLKTDTIVVTTQTPLYYYISDYSYFTHVYYGMFGPVSCSDCKLDCCTINNKIANGQSAALYKSEGWKKPLIFKQK
jgi:hypothetical protein